MKLKTIIFAAVIMINQSTICQNISIEHLTMLQDVNKKQYSKVLLPNEIKGIKVEHCAIAGNVVDNAVVQKGFKYIYLFIKGQGTIWADGVRNIVNEEAIFLPNSTGNFTISATNNETLHYLKIGSELTAQDIIDLQQFPVENISKPYFANFTDCEPYTEAIKSPRTISRTLMSNKFIPRIAMGTVETTGPDIVAPHKHPMLEQLFLGLANNQILVRADDAKVDLTAYSLLHIPLGSNHSSEVAEGQKMYYVWMDFFLDSKGEEWLKMHKTMNNNE